MKERPILFSAPMVRALLAGTKTQTRRVVKAKMSLERHAAINPHGDAFLVEYWPKQERMMGNFGRCESIVCPYGQPGDQLWVKEALCQHNNYGFPLGPSVEATMFTGSGERVWSYAADSYGDHTRMRPSIHMPRWASRITLEITGVRVERLQDISESDAQAEGCQPNHMPQHPDMTPYRAGYSLLWEQINGPRSYADNPRVWCVEFKLATPNAPDQARRQASPGAQSSAATEGKK